MTYTYANGVVMTCKPGNPSIKFIGTDGWVGNRGWRRAAGGQFGGDPELGHRPGRDPSVHEPSRGTSRLPGLRRRARKDPYFPVDIGHRVATVCHLANIAIKLGRKLKWDPVAEQFTGDAAALVLMDRPRRDPWQLPKVP